MEASQRVGDVSGTITKQWEGAVESFNRKQSFVFKGEGRGVREHNSSSYEPFGNEIKRREVKKAKTGNRVR